MKYVKSWIVKGHLEWESLERNVEGPIEFTEGGGGLGKFSKCAMRIWERGILLLWEGSFNIYFIGHNKIEGCLCPFEGTRSWLKRDGLNEIVALISVLDGLIIWGVKTKQNNYYQLTPR